MHPPEPRQSRQICQTVPLIEQIENKISSTIDHDEGCQNAHLTSLCQLVDLPVMLWKTDQYSALMAVQPMTSFNSYSAAAIPMPCRSNRNIMKKLKRVDFTLLHYPILFEL